MEISVIIPAKNESLALRDLLVELKETYPDFEIVVVNDGSTDETAALCAQLGIVSVNHPYSMGNGAAIKAGARKANGEAFIFMDADGQHKVSDIAALLDKYRQGYDMVVGARDKDSQSSTARWLANSVYNRIASFIVNQPVEDLTSGLRMANARKFKEFLYLLPNGFSYPSTITLAFFRMGYTVAYVPIKTEPRIGRSHLRPLTDGPRFLVILYKMTVLYSPLKVFLPFAILHFVLGLANYAYTYSTQGRFTNMSGVLFSASVIIFLMGLVSEQITALMYQRVCDRAE